MKRKKTKPLVTPRDPSHEAMLGRKGNVILDGKTKKKKKACRKKVEEEEE